MESISEKSGHFHHEQLLPDYRFVPENIRADVGGKVDEMLQRSELRERLSSFLTSKPQQREIDVQQLLDMKFTTAESIAAVAILEPIIRQRWREGNYVMHCDPASVDLSSFEGLPV